MTAFARFRDWAVDYPGSTRSVALMRIGFVLIGWYEFGDVVKPYKVNPLLSLFFYVATVLALIGYRAPYATFAAGVAFMLVRSYVPSLTLQHTYLLAVSTMLLALTPCGRSLSVDRLRTRAPEEGNLWALRLIGVEVCAVLLWSGYHKLTLGFLSGDRLEQMLAFSYGGLPVVRPGWAKLLFPLLGTSFVLVELAAPVLLWLPKYRMKMLVACVLMTVFLELLVPIRAFGFVSLVLYLAFVPPKAVHLAIERLRGAPVLSDS